MSRALVLCLTFHLAIAGCGDGDSSSGAGNDAGSPASAMTAPELAPYLEIPDEPACSTCRVELEDLVTLEDSPEAPIPAAPSTVVEDGSGRYWLTFSNELPLVYGSDGQLLRQLGPRGQGPNEYQYPSVVFAVPGDSIVVFERSRAGLVILGPDLMPARTIRLGIRAGIHGPPRGQLA